MSGPCLCGDPLCPRCFVQPVRRRTIAPEYIIERDGAPVYSDISEDRAVSYFRLACVPGTRESTLRGYLRNGMGSGIRSYSASHEGAMYRIAVVPR